MSRLPAVPADAGSRQNFDEIAAKTLLPGVGDYRLVPGNQPVPDGWLSASGQEISRATYREAFLAMGTVYGAGDTATTFNLPNFAVVSPVTGPWARYIVRVK